MGMPPISSVSKAEMGMASTDNLVRTEKTRQKKKKRDDIQGLRGIAIIAVIGFHVNVNACPNGYLGVDIFFALSGYLMASILSRYEHLDLGSILDFYSRRLKRILPMYSFMLVVVSIAAPIVFAPMEMEIYKETLLYSMLLVTYMHSLKGLPRFVTGQLWSISLELQYYLLIPFVVLVCRFLPKFYMRMAVYIALFIGSTYLCDADYSNNNLSVIRVFRRAFQFLIGSIVHEIPYSGRLPQHPLSMVVCVLLTGALVIVNFLPITLPVIAARIATTLLSGALLHAGKSVQCFVLKFKPLTYIGDISYVLYLTNTPAFCLFWYISGQDFNFVQGIIVVPSVVLIAIVVHHLLENPFVKTTDIKAYAFCIVAYIFLIAVYLSPVLQLFSDFLHPVSNSTVKDAIAWNENEMYLVNLPYPPGFKQEITAQSDLTGALQDGFDLGNGSLVVGVVGDIYACRSFASIVESFPADSASFVLFCQDGFSLLTPNTATDNPLTDLYSMAKPDVTLIATRELTLFNSASTPTPTNPGFAAFQSNINYAANNSQLVVMLTPAFQQLIGDTYFRKKFLGPMMQMTVMLSLSPDHANLDKLEVTIEQYNATQTAYRQYFAAVSSPKVLTLDVDTPMCEDDGTCLMYNPANLHGYYNEVNGLPSSEAYVRLMPTLQEMANRVLTMVSP